ncbi:MAG: CRISPR-associated endoribonuclease Cas6 [Thermodesulfobacteriota bacterium]
MRAALEFQTEKDFKLPIHHNHIIQGFIYNSISKKLAKMLHDKGFVSNNRKFKLFTFSRVEGNFRINKNDNSITFTPPFRLVISSALNQFIEEIGNEMLRKENLKISANNVKVNSIEISKPEFKEDKVKIKMLSPMTIYSTLSKADGKKKTYYYSPFEDEFSQLISENAKKKFNAFSNNGKKTKEPDGGIKLKPLKVNSNNQKIINYKETIIKGWMGIYELSGSMELLKMVHDTGLGGKNSQGFGCFEVIDI